MGYSAQLGFDSGFESHVLKNGWCRMVLKQKTKSLPRVAKVVLWFLQVSLSANSTHFYPSTQHHIEPTQ
jgi:hypothetical protein